VPPRIQKRKKVLFLAALANSNHGVMACGYGNSRASSPLNLMANRFEARVAAA
jgi:hypothetical protein